jgi:hypothetical protein
MPGVGSGGAYPDILCFKAPSAPEAHYSAESAICSDLAAEGMRDTVTVGGVHTQAGGTAKQSAEIATQG